MGESGVVLLHCSLSHLSASQVEQLKEYDMKQGQKCDAELVIYIFTYQTLFDRALVFGLLGVLFGRLDIKIVPVEALTWSWKDLRSKLLSRLRIALLGGLLSGLLFALLYTNLGYGLFSVLIITPFFWLIAGLLGGLSRKQLTECFNLSPNEGIRCSIKNGLVIALLCGLVIGSFFSRSASLI